MSKIKKNKQCDISIETISEITDLFNRKQWEKEDEVKPDSGNLFDRFCMMLERLNRDERDLLIKLTNNFIRIKFLDYFELLKDIFINIDISRYDKCDNIFLLPIVSKDDHERYLAKSADALLYPIDIFIFNGDLSKYSTKVKRLSDVRGLDFHCNRNSSLVVFVDDFIGTGNTAISALELYEPYKRSNDDVIIVSIAIQNDGYRRIINAGYDVHYKYIINKGITDSGDIENKENAIEVMLNIEKNLNIRSTFSLGYRKSQALISMARTPNNTFPVYWCKKAVDRGLWPAPFAR